MHYGDPQKTAKDSERQRKPGEARMPLITDLPDDARVTTAELASYLRVHRSTVEKWRTDGRGPKYRKVAGLRGRVTYVVEAVNEWFDTEYDIEVDPTEQPSVAS